MTNGPACVLDASALLAYVQGERGSDAVERALELRAALSAVNLAETLSRLADLGGGARRPVGPVDR